MPKIATETKTAGRKKTCIKMPKIITKNKAFDFITPICGSTCFVGGDSFEAKLGFAEHEEPAGVGRHEGGNLHADGEDVQGGSGVGVGVVTRHAGASEG